MSNAQHAFSSGQARGEGEAKADQWAGTIKDKAHTVSDSASEVSQHAQEHREHAAGFLEQTGEHLKQMAQDASDAVKNAVGVGSTDGAPGHGTSTISPSGKHH